MAYGNRYYRRRYSGRSYTRTYRRRRTYTVRRRRFRRYRRRSTKSAIVKLTTETGWSVNLGANTTWPAFQFSPGASLPGFSDYASVYSHFRITKAVLKVNLQDGKDLHFLVAPSRPFATTIGPFNSSATQAASQLVPNQTENALRQTKWQRELYPSTTRTAVRVGFKPYIMTGSTGPTNGSGAPVDYYRIHEGRRFMPMSWAIPVGGTSSQPAIFWGPYIAASTWENLDPGSSTTVTFHASLTVYCQFRGQK